PLVSPDQNFLTVAGSLLALKIVALISFSGLVVGIFRLLGGTGNYQTTLCACLYIVSPVYLFLLVTQVVNIGILATHDPVLALKWRTGQGFDDELFQHFIDTSPGLFLGFLLVWLSQVLISTVWFLICWGTYRTIHNVSWIRSSVAYVLTTALWYIYWILTVLITKGLHSGLLSPIG
ncbi:MAG: hypothetical protein V7677_11785, partial [Motiliproteus sp.]